MLRLFVCHVVSLFLSVLCFFVCLCLVCFSVYVVPVCLSVCIVSLCLSVLCIFVGLCLFYPFLPMKSASVHASSIADQVTFLQSSITIAIDIMMVIIML